MSTLEDFTESDDDEPTDIDRTEKPKVRRRYPVKDPDDKSTLYGMLAEDYRRGGFAYTSPRKRDRNYFRRIGGYPISTDILELLRDPPARSNVDPVRTIYIIQREGTDDHPPMTVFEYHIRDYLDAAVIDFDPFGEQRCPTLDDARAVWPAWGDLLFDTGKL